MAKFFIDRPVFAMVLSIVIVIVGAVALKDLPIAEYPDVTPPQINVEATYTGADARTIEETVATPLEQEINGVENMIYVKSINTNDGDMDIQVFFEVGTDLDTANVLVQNRVSQGSAALPEDVKRQGVTVKKSNGTPLMIISLVSPNNTYDALFLSNYATLNLQDEILRTSGVGDVTMFGAADYAMRVWVKPDQLAKLKMTPGDLRKAINEQNVQAPAGKVGAEPAPPGQQFTYTVRTRGRLPTAEEFGEIVVRSNPDGSSVKLKDVARVELGGSTYSYIGRVNGKPAAIMMIYQIPGSNALEVVEGIRAKMEVLKERFPGDLEYLVSLDTTRSVTAGIDEIIHTLFEAIVLVILVVFIFLQSWRATLIPLITVPVSLIGVFAIFPLVGFSVNTLTLFGLVLAIGIVVDDAIVVVEAVEHHIEHGMSPRDATFKAMEEVSGPVVAIALILCSVFVPVAFMGGLTGRLYQQFALTLAFSVALSALNALTLSPALSALLLKPRKPSKGPLGKFFAGFNKLFNRATDGYISVAGLLTRKFVISIVIMLGVIALTGFLGWTIPSGFLPQEDLGYFMANVQLPDAASLQRTNAAARKMEKIFSELEGVESYTTIGGYSFLSGAASSFSTTYFVSLKPWEEREDAHVETLLQKVNAAFRKIPEANAIAFSPPPIPSLGTGSGFSVFLQDRSGGTPEFLADGLDEFMAKLRERPEIGSATSLYRSRVPQLYADVDREQALKAGVDVSEVNSVLQTFLGGLYVNDFSRFGRSWKVFVQAEPQYRVTPEDIGQFFVRSKEGAMVPLSALVKIDPTSGPDFTNRFNLFRSAEVTGSPAPGYSSGDALAAIEEVAATLPREFGYAWSSVSYQEKIAAGGAAMVFALAIVFVFLILAAQYESWSIPFSVLLGTPFAILGAFLGIFLGRYDLNVYGQIGLIMLIGLAAKNAILIVEFAKANVEAGKPLLEGTLEAARLRFRPILMTAFAFILGVVPLMLASGAGAASRKTMGTAVFAGMLIATILGVLLVPALFYMIAKLTGAKAKVPQTEPGTPMVTAPAEGAH